MTTSSSLKQEKNTAPHQECDHQSSMAMPVNTVPPHLPDLVIHQILQLLPTKSAIRMSFLTKQWQAACCFGPVIDFDEGGDSNNVRKHTKFVKNILQRYSEFCEKDPKKQNIEKFKLHMTRYSSRDANIVTKWLSITCKRSVQELDISLKPVSELHSHPWSDMRNYDMLSRMELMNARTANRIENFFYLSQMALVNAKSLTTLSLEYVRIKKIYNGDPLFVGLLPSMRSISFKTVHFDYEALFSLICECPVIEHLSVTSSSFDDDINIRSSSLKSLEIERCEAFLVRVYEAKNLESLSVVSGIGSTEFPLLDQVILRDCSNLKNMNINGSHLQSFYLDGCQDVKGTIDAPELDFFTFVGYLNSKFSMKAPSLKMTRIVLLDDWDRNSASSSSRQWKYFTALSDFLQEFAMSKTLDLCVSDFKAVVFPKNFRKTLSPPLFPNLEKLYFSAKIPAATETRDEKDLKDSLLWMAPYLQLIKYLRWKIRSIPFL